MAEKAKMWFAAIAAGDGGNDRIFGPLTPSEIPGAIAGYEESARLWQRRMPRRITYAQFLATRDGAALSGQSERRRIDQNFDSLESLEEPVAPIRPTEAHGHSDARDFTPRSPEDGLINRVAAPSNREVEEDGRVRTPAHRVSSGDSAYHAPHETPARFLPPTLRRGPERSEEWIPGETARPDSSVTPAESAPLSPKEELPAWEEEIAGRMGDAVRVLRSWRQARLREKRTVLEAELDKISSGDPDAFRRATSEAHQLRRAAEIFGEGAIAEAAFVLESGPAADAPANLRGLLAAIDSSRDDRAQEKGALLLVEPDKGRRERLEELLGTNGSVVHSARDAEDARKVLHATPIQVLLANLRLPDAEGRSFLSEIAERPETRDITILSMADEEEEPAGEDSMTCGAEAYFRFPIDATAMERAISAKMSRTLLRIGAARIDALTGLPTRTVYCESLERAISFSHRTGHPLSTAMIDLHGLDELNRTHGRRVGDDAIARLGAALRATFRSSDIVARWHGGMFAVIFPNTLPHHAGRALEKALAAANKIVLEPAGTSVTFTAGVAGVREGAFVEEMVARAVGHLLRAKDSGNSNISCEASGEKDLHLRVLIAEHDATVRDVLEHRFRRDGFEVETYDDGGDAMEAAFTSGRKYALFVVDTYLPKITGLEFIRRVRATPSHARIPVMLLSVEGGETSTEEALSIGANDYVTKPFSPADLMARVRRMLRPL